MSKLAALGIASTIAVGMIVYFIRKNRHDRVLVNVADAGYETAEDILYPLRNQRLKKM